MRSHILSLVIYTVAVALPLSACSLLKGSTHYGAERTVVGVSAEYLSYIVRGDATNVRPMILWDEYLRNKDGLTPEGYFRQLRDVKKRFKPQEHPLVNLDLEEVDVSVNEAEVVFRKASVSNSPEIVINLFWTGGGWIVYDDSLFGKSELFAELLQEPHE